MISRRSLALNASFNEAKKILPSADDEFWREWLWPQISTLTPLRYSELSQTPELFVISREKDVLERWTNTFIVTLPYDLIIRLKIAFKNLDLNEDFWKLWLEYGFYQTPLEQIFDLDKTFLGVTLERSAQSWLLSSPAVIQKWYIYNYLLPDKPTGISWKDFAIARYRHSFEVISPDGTFEYYTSFGENDDVSFYFIYRHNLKVETKDLMSVIDKVRGKFAHSNLFILKRVMGDKSRLAGILIPKSETDLSDTTFSGYNLGHTLLNTFESVLYSS